MSSVSVTATQRWVLRGVSFAYRTSAPLLERVDLSLAPGWSGLVGANGSGKTTLLRLLSGALAPSTGTIAKPPDARIALVEQEIDACPGHALAARDDREAIRLRASLRLEVDALARWGSLSPGERRRWQIGAALAEAPDLLLLDEPTNHLDAEGRALLVRALRAYRGVGLVVSHDRALLDALTQTTVRVERGSVRAWPLAYGEARAAWDAEALATTRAREQQREVVQSAERALDRARREHASAERGRATSRRMRSKHDSDARGIGPSTRAMWAETGAGRVVARRHAELERAREQLDGHAPSTRARGRSIFLGFEAATRRAVLTIDADTIEVADRTLLRDVRLSLARDARVRLVGPNGAGKTTLLAAMLRGASDPRLLYVPQVIAPARTREVIAELRALDPRTKGRALGLIAALGADPGRLLATGEASPGEARQLAIASGLSRQAHTIVLDEPTNDLDLPAVERLEDALADFPGALLVVTHDDAFAARLALEAWRIEAGRVHVS